MSYTVNVPRKHEWADVNKSTYYVCYLGWKESRGLAGREYTEPVIKDLVTRRQREVLPKLTIEVTATALEIYQLKKNKLGQTVKDKFPKQPSEDVTYAVQGLPPDADIVACIYLGYNRTTRRAVHVHAYRFDVPQTAAIFVEHMNSILRQPTHKRRLDGIERELVARGEIVPRPVAVGNAFDVPVDDMGPLHLDNLDDLSDRDSGSPQSPHFHGEYDENSEYSKEKEIKQDILAKELTAVLRGRTEAAPILLPPQDYDTHIRVKGNMQLPNFGVYKERKSQTEAVVGQQGVTKPNSVSVDSARADSGMSVSPKESRHQYVTTEMNSFDIHGTGSSDDRSDDHTPVARSDSRLMPKNRPRLSQGSFEPLPTRQENDGIQVVSPRWKTANQVYVPPSSVTGHAAKTASVSSGSSGHRAHSSPDRHSGHNPRHSGTRNYPAPHGHSQLDGRPVHRDPIVRQRSDDVGMSSRNSDDYSYSPNLSASFPAAALQPHLPQHNAGSKDKKKTKGSRKEPPPDYTLHPVRRTDSSQLVLSMYRETV